MSQVLIINGAYRPEGVIAQALAQLGTTLVEAGVKVEWVELNGYPIEFCHNCRQCMQHPGRSPGHCILSDGMSDLVAQMERADAIVLASPTNFGSVTALFKRFMERLAVYGYWPWSAPGPQLRKLGLVPKPAVLLDACAAPGWIGRWLYRSQPQLAYAAKVVGAKPVARATLGGMAGQPQPTLTASAKKQVARAAQRLLQTLEPAT